MEAVIEKEGYLEFRNITKKFPGVLAVDDVSITIRESEIHCLLGENGAGKTTLINILCGVHRADSGDIFLKGQRLEIENPAESQKLGIAVIHQELNLIPSLSVVENLFINQYSMKKGLPGIIDWKTTRQRARELLLSLGLDIDVDIQVRDLNTYQRQMVEIARALSYKAKILVMDEPTSSLEKPEVELLFKIIKNLSKQSKTTIIYISHHLEEIQEVGDRATILKGGKYIATVDVDKVQPSEIVRLIVGRELEEKFPKVSATTGEELLRVKDLNVPGKLRNINLTLKAGEILGLAGVVGSGRNTLGYFIFGHLRPESGEIFIRGRKMNIKEPSDAIQQGIALLTEDRKEKGLFLNHPLTNNISIAALQKIEAHFMLQLKREREFTADYIQKLSIVTPSINQKAVNLSGGNQQKVIVARWFFADAQIIFFNEPTRGIDIETKVDMYKVMNNLVARGAGIILSSAEIPELIGMCDRVLVMKNGTIIAERKRDELSEENLLGLVIG
jgi:ABC-type sugar transport system ATPase subunit